MASLTLANIETRVMNRLGLPTTNTTETAKIDALINDVYRDIGMKHDWWWLLKRQHVNTVDDISTGTVNVTNNSTSAIFSSAPALSTAQRVLYVSGNAIDPGAIYRISAHAAGATAFTLASVYTGATSTAASYRVYQDEYDLATDVGKVLYIRRFGRQNSLKFVSPEEMWSIKNWDVSTGKPEIATVADFDTSGDPTTQKQLIVHPYPDAIYRLEIEYKQTLNTELSGSTRPLIPDDYVSLLEWGSLAFAFPLWHKDTQRGLFYQAKFNDMLALMVSDNIGRMGTYTRFTYDDQYRRFYRRGRRLRTAGVNLGSFFDRWPSEP